jgi:hypothetical protein
MKRWRFLNYHSEAGNNLVERWYRDQSVAVQADFDVTLNNLAGMEDWRDTHEFKMLKGKYSGLGEIRFKTGNVQYRPIGTFGCGEKTFAILLGCRKKGSVYNPPDAFDLALRNKGLVAQGKGGFVEHFGVIAKPA